MVYLQPLARLVHFLDTHLFRHKWWPWILPLVCFLLSISLSWRYNHPGYPSTSMKWHWHYYDYKFEHVWEPTQQLYTPDSHLAKLDGRIVVPALAHYLKLSNTGVIIFYHLCGGLLFFSVYQLAWSYSASTSIASLFTLGIAGLICGNEAFNAEPFYDTVCLLFLVLCLLSPNLFVKGLLILLALLTDERAIGGLPALVVNQFWSLDDTQKQPLRRFATALWPILTPLLIWIALRVIMWLGLGLKTPNGGMLQLDSLRQMWAMVPLAWLLCLEAFWILPLLALLAVMEKCGWFTTLLFIAAVAVPVLLPLTVYDLSRSLIHMLLPLLLALRILCTLEKRWLAEILLLATAINLLMPNYTFYHPVPQYVPNLPMQLFFDRKR